MKVMICGHEPTATERLERIINDLGYVAMVCQGSKEAALTLLKARRPEVLLLSAAMPEVTQICLAASQEINHPPAVILLGKEDLSAYSVFSVGVADYLLSPVEKETLAASLQKVAKLSAAQAWTLAKKPADKERVRQYIAARTHRGVEMVSMSDVYYFAADQKYVKVRHKNGLVLIDETLKELEQEFEGMMFRIHRNALVNLEYLELLETVDNGQYQVRFRGMDEKLCVSRRHLPTLREKIQHI